MENATLHAFNRLAFGPRPEDLELEGQQLEEHVEAQLHPSGIDDQAVEEELSGLDALNLSGLELIRKYPERRDQRIGLEQLTRAKLIRALKSERQLNEVMVDFWYTTSMSSRARASVGSWCPPTRGKRSARTSLASSASLFPRRPGIPRCCSTWTTGSVCLRLPQRGDDGVDSTRTMPGS